MNRHIKHILLAKSTWHLVQDVLLYSHRFIHRKRAGGSPCLQAWGGSPRPIDAKTTQYADFQFIDFCYKICYNFSSEKR